MSPPVTRMAQSSQGISARLVCVPPVSRLPASTAGRSPSWKKPPPAAWAPLAELSCGSGRRSASSRLTDAASGPSRSATKSARSERVAPRILAIDSIDGQRGRPSAAVRFDGLKVVGSSPARRARPEGVSPLRRASRSMADQTVSCESMVWLRCRLPGNGPGRAACCCGRRRDGRTPGAVEAARPALPVRVIPVTGIYS